MAMEAPVVSADEIRDIIYADADGCFTSDIRRMKSDIHEVKSEVKRIRKELETYQVEMLKFQDETRAFYQKILSMICPDGSLEHNHSQSLLAPVSVQSKEEPFLVVKYPDGKIEPISVPDGLQKQWMGSGTTRELVRQSLLFAHDMLELRKFTLTGRSASNENDIDSDDFVDSQDSSFTSVSTHVGSPAQPKERLPLRTILIAQTAVMKIFPVDQAYTGNPKLFQRELDTRMSQTRAHITAILNYFRTEYGEDGKKIKKPRKSK